jgi:flagellar biosynthesis protein FlhF
MAKLASKLILEEKLKVAMFSVDTYRIAAIDQIKTYANILSAPMEVVYTPDDMQKYVEKYNNYDIVMVDTAGRSHTNESQNNDLVDIINSVEDYEKEVYLVLSVTTKYSDLLNIANTYSKLFDFKYIFTKLDETRGIGNILNLKLDTDKTLAYVTWGQNVPDDIGEINPQVIAKKLLGGAD